MHPVLQAETDSRVFTDYLKGCSELIKVPNKGKNLKKSLKPTNIDPKGACSKINSLFDLDKKSIRCNYCHKFGHIAT